MQVIAESSLDAKRRHSPALEQTRTYTRVIQLGRLQTVIIQRAEKAKREMASKRRIKKCVVFGLERQWLRGIMNK